MATLTMRMAAAIMAQPKPGWTFDNLEPVLQFQDEPYEIRTVATMVGRDLAHKGWTKRVGARGQKNTYTALDKVFIDNAFQMDLMMEMIPDNLRFETRQRWEKILAQDKPDEQQAETKKPFSEMSGAEKMAHIKKDSYKTYQINNANITKAQFFRALVASEPSTFTTGTLLTRAKAFMPDAKHSLTQAPMTKHRKRKECIQVTMAGRTPIMKATDLFFLHHQGEREKYLAAFPEREEIINDHFFRALNPDRNDLDDLPAAGDTPSSSPPTTDDVAGEPESTHKELTESQESQPSSPEPTVKTDQERLQSEGMEHPHELDPTLSPAAGITFNHELPATYIVGKCIIDYLSMVGVDPLPGLFPTQGSLQKPPESGSDIQNEDATSITSEQKHEIKHMLAQKDEKISEKNRRILELTNHNQSLVNQVKRINHRLEEALRENAHIKMINSKQMVQLERLGQKQRSGYSNGTFGLGEVVRITGKVPSVDEKDSEGNGATIIRKQG